MAATPYCASAAPTKAAKAAAPAPQEQRSVTHHRITIDGHSISYTATAGTLIVKDAKDQLGASVFYVAYTEDGADSSRRPVTFLYNGGPGAASVFLHMGAFGPRRIAFPNAASSGGPPYGLVDNQYSLLDKSDLVFIDAPGTGYSRLLPKADPKSFYGIDQDAAAFGHFIERYVTLNNRWNSPKFLLGESYGTPRSAALVDWLQSNGSMSFNGVILLSSVLDFDTIAPGPGNDLAYATFLPTEAAVTWYHNKSSNKPPLSAVIDEARKFANGEYLDALMEGDRVPHDQFVKTAQELSKLLGIDEHYIELSNLRVTPDRYEKQLKRDSGETVGRLDARYVGYDLDTVADASDYDPSDSATSGAFQSGFLTYARNELNYRSDETYRQINDTANSTWDFTRKSVWNWVAPSVSPDLREAMTTNSRLRVFVGAGYFDLATPFGAAEWTFSHLGLPAELRSHVTFGYYPSGHMVYMNIPSLAQFKSDLSRFYDQATAQ